MDMKVGVRKESPLYELWKTLFYNCEAGSTGTLFIATDENRSGQIVLHKGRLIGAAYNGEYNLTALMTLTYLQDARFSYTPDLVFPIPETLLPEESALLLEQLGFQDYLNDLINESKPLESPQATPTRKDHNSLANVQSESRLDPDEGVKQTDVHNEIAEEPHTVTYMYRGQKLTKTVAVHPEAVRNTKGSVKIYRGQVIEH